MYIFKILHLVLFILSMTGFILIGNELRKNKMFRVFGILVSIVGGCGIVLAIVFIFKYMYMFLQSLGWW